MFPPRLLRSWNMRWKTPSNSRWNWMLKWKLAPAGGTCRSWSCDSAVWLCHAWGGRKAPWAGQDEPGITCWRCDPPVLCACGWVPSCLLKHVVEAGMNSPNQTLQSSVTALKRVFGSVKLLIVKRRIFKWILLKCAWSACTTPKSVMNLLQMKWAGLCY